VARRRVDDEYGYPDSPVVFANELARDHAE
jgi:hypothetical protein